MPDGDTAQKDQNQEEKHMEKISFGKTTKGEEASLYTLTNSNGMKVSVTDLGATIVSVCVPDGKGVLTDVVLGYRDSDLFLKEEFTRYASVYVSTEDGSVGTKGNVIDAIRANELEADTIYACGPMPMLRGVKAYAAEKKTEAQISMEERMACGIGACLGCVCQSTDVDGHSHVHNKRVCKDGPVFNAKDVTL